MSARQFARRDLIDELAAQPIVNPEDVVLNHGAALVTWGVREEHTNGDIDGAASLRNIRALRMAGWVVHRRIVGESTDGTPVEIVSTADMNGRFDIHRWDFSPQRYKETDHGRIYLPELKEKSQQDSKTGIWVMLPEHDLALKEEIGRPQDEEDIALLHEFLKKQP